MTKNKSAAVEEDNRRQIDGLKDTLNELNLAVALNTEATKGLKDVLERELSRQSSDLKELANRTSVLENRVDVTDVTLAKNTSMEKWAIAVDDRFSKIENTMASGFKEFSGVIQTINSRLDVGDGWSKGVKVTVILFLGVSAPCLGFVAAQVLDKVFGMGLR